MQRIRIIIYRIKEELENARGEKTSYKYDEAGRIIESTSKDGTTKYTYDDNGNIIKYKNEKTETNMSYGSNN